MSGRPEDELKPVAKKTESTKAKRREKSVSPAVTAHAFQVNLAGVIELLSAHLYSGPQVYLRELLQNAVDAIAARQLAGPALAGEITVELLAGAGGAATLIFEDNGIGLTEEEIHRFLATIGSSSKRQDLPGPTDFIGQFGIGLLSGFMVSDEIVMVTRSVQAGPAYEWRGRSDGSYSVRALPGSEVQPGTKVFLRAKPAADEISRRITSGITSATSGLSCRRASNSFTAMPVRS